MYYYDYSRVGNKRNSYAIARHRETEGRGDPGNSLGCHVASAPRNDKKNANTPPNNRNLSVAI